ncbi:hypothetical protein ABZ897_55275 [Nonomuraea sp. NPDC046802]|uniref:hypothetical protein n=1 Tax=Nonomuraea sp. NPDC046802 TaxID=3154919 RepID=UPI00340DA6A4
MADVMPPIERPDFSDLHLQFAALRDSLGLPPTERDLNVRLELASKQGLFIDEVGPIWNQIPDVAKAIKNLDQHLPVIGQFPAAERIQRTVQSTNRLGTSMRRAFGQHYNKITAHPRVQAFFQTVRKFVTRQISHEVRDLQDRLANVTGRLDNTTADPAQARQDVQRLQKQLDAALRGPGTGGNPSRFDLRAQAARLRTSTAAAPPKRTHASTDQPQRTAAQHRSATPRRTPMA